MAGTLIQLKGIVRGRTVELERELGLPNGESVTVTVAPNQSRGDIASLRQAFGGWSDDPAGLDTFLAEVRDTWKLDRKRAE